LVQEINYLAKKILADRPHGRVPVILCKNKSNSSGAA
jgi:hypothetical protein